MEKAKAGIIFFVYKDRDNDLFIEAESICKDSLRFSMNEAKLEAFDTWSTIKEKWKPVRKLLSNPGKKSW